MKILVIDDNPKYRERIYAEFDDNRHLKLNLFKTEDFSSLEPREICESIIKEFYKDRYGNIINKDFIEVSDEKVLFFLNIEGVYNGSKRQDIKGLEVLLWLRCKYKIKNPFILYGFQTPAQLLKKTVKNVILNATGSYYHQLPLDLSKIKKNFNDGKYKSIDDWSSFKPYIKPLFSFEEIRHSEANWWGVKQLWDTHKKITTSFNQDYPKSVKEKLNSLNNTIASFLYENTGEINIEKNQITAINGLRKLINTNLKIIYIDDQCDEGWSDILKNVIYKVVNNANFQPIKPPLNKNCDNIDIDTLFKKIESEDPDIILLDLRLFPFYDNKQGNDVNKMSGARLLKTIRQKLPAIPVIMTTASNKVWSFENLMNIGADGYWIKEGLDDKYASQQTIENYKRLLELIRNASSEEYQFLKKFSEDIKKINNNRLWWKHREITSINVDIVDIKKEDLKNISHILNHILLKLRSYCYQYIMHQGHQNQPQTNNDLETSYLKSIMLDIGFIIEIIHQKMPNQEFGYKTIGGYFCTKNNKIITNRGDWRAMFLYILRNKAAHYKEADLDFKKIISVLDELIKWLNNPINYKEKPKEIIPTKTWDNIIEQLHKIENN